MHEPRLWHIANAYARLSLRDDLLFDDIADEVIRRPEEFKASTKVPHKGNDRKLWDYTVVAK